MNNIIINDCYETVTCRLCGEQCSRVYGMHLRYKHNNMKSEEYKKMFPDAPMTAPKDKEATSKNSGKHMQTEEYKKMFSEKIKGDKNPNHKSKTTKEERQSRSPFSKKFVKYDGIDNVEEHISKFAKEAIKDRVSDTTLEYWLNKGFNEEEAKIKLKERQTTFTLEKCIAKYGEVEGIEVYNERQINWQKTMFENGNVKCGFSMISQELFDKIYESYGEYKEGDVYYATKNKEYFLNKKGVGFFVYDYVDLVNRKIIEYNGDQYHANPNKYNENDFPHPYYKENGPSAKEIWEKDAIKRKCAEDNGFEVLYIWDSEFSRVGVNKRKAVIDKCIAFLKK